MDEKLRGQIKNELSLHSTNELVEIWKLHNTDEWEQVTFEIIREILMDRLGEIPIFDDTDTPNEEKQILDENDSTGEEIQPFNEKEFEIDHSTWINLVDIDFSNSEANELIDLALEYAEDEDFDLALQSIEKAVPLISKTATELTLLGEVWLAVNKPHEALIAFEEAIRMGREYSRPRTGRRNALALINSEPLQPNFRVSPEEVAAVNEKVLEFSDIDFEQNQETIDETPDWVYRNLDAILIRGSVGFRNRSGRSGLDPLDSQMDEARFEGLLIRLLFTGHLRTHDTFYQVMMFLVGSILLFPVVYLAGSPTLFDYPIELLCSRVYLLPSIISGGLIYYNLVLSLLSTEPEEMRDIDSKFF